MAIEHSTLKGTQLQQKQLLKIKDLKKSTKQMAGDHFLLPALSVELWTHLIFSLH
jgi:hypothetical protein